MLLEEVYTALEKDPLHTGSEAEAIISKHGLLTVCQHALLHPDDDDFACFLQGAVRRPTIASDLLTNSSLADVVAMVLGSENEQYQLILVTAVATLLSSKPSVPIQSSASKIVLKLITSPFTSVGTRSTDLLSLIIKPESIDSLSPELDILSSPPITDEVRLRTLSAIIQSAEAQPILFDKCSFFIDRALSLFFTDDILLKLISVEILQRISRSDTGREYVARNPKYVSALNEELQSDDIDSSVLIAVMSILGSMSHRTPRFAFHLKRMLNRSSRASEVAELLCGLRVLMALASTGPVEGDFLAPILKAMDSADEQGLQAACDCAAVVISTGQGGEDYRRDVGEKASKMLELKPFPEVRAHNWALLSELVEFGGPARLRLYLAEGSPVRRVLCDWMSESSYEPRMAKWEFVRRVMSSADRREIVSSLLGLQLLADLTSYARDGPGFAPGRESIAVVERLTQ